MPWRANLSYRVLRGSPSEAVTAEIDPAWVAGRRVVGVTAGASAPEDLVQGVLDRLAERFAVQVEMAETAQETVSFKLPRLLAEPA